MNIDVRLRSIDLAKALAKAGKMERQVRAMVTIAAREDTKPYVPYKQGPLRDSANTESQPEDGLLVYGSSSVPYAAAQYYGLPGKRTPGTTMQWFEHSKSANLSKWIRIAQEEAEKVAKS